MADLEYYREAERLAKAAQDYEGLPNNHHVQLGQIAQVYALLSLADAICGQSHPNVVVQYTGETTEELAAKIRNSVMMAQGRLR